MYILQAPNYPNPGRCWDIVDKYQVTIFYTAPTLVRSLMRDSDEARYLTCPYFHLCGCDIFNVLLLIKTIL